MKKVTLLFAFTIFLLCAGLIYMQLLDRQSLEKDVKATYLKGGAFTLTHADQEFNSISLVGQPHILYFGFTFCPDVCPVGLATIRDALNSDNRLSVVKAMFVTVDPERDDSTRLEDYTSFFHPNIMGLTGSLESIKTVAKQYGTYFKKADKSNAENYTVDHTAYYYLIDKEGELLRVLDHSATSKEISELLLKML